ncbi:hypothetical protein AVL50_26915 [Flammeovirga sp. SJP92]|nr:hypothetical protein AVL50_26915 [Flammeovirga sp. SJP92]
MFFWEELYSLHKYSNNALSPLDGGLLKPQNKYSVLTLVEIIFYWERKCFLREKEEFSSST